MAATFDIMLMGERVRLREMTLDDVDATVRIRSSPEVRERWMSADVEADLREAVLMGDLHYLAIEDDAGAIIGGIQWAAEPDPDYRHASIDIYLDPAVHGRGLCLDSVRTLARYLFDDVGHHRLTIDPAADNDAAIGCYAKVGFRPVGVMRQYERGPDGSWHDGLLMELLADDFGD